MVEFVVEDNILYISLMWEVVKIDWYVMCVELLKGKEMCYGYLCQMFLDLFYDVYCINFCFCIDMVFFNVKDVVVMIVNGSGYNLLFNNFKGKVFQFMLLSEVELVLFVVL